MVEIDFNKLSYIGSIQSNCSGMSTLNYQFDINFLEYNIFYYDNYLINFTYKTENYTQNNSNEIFNIHIIKSGINYIKIIDDNIDLYMFYNKNEYKPNFEHKINFIFGDIEYIGDIELYYFICKTKWEIYTKNELATKIKNHILSFQRKNKIKNLLSY